MTEKHMKIYIVKITNQHVVNEILAGNEFVYDGIYNFESQLQIGDPVFIYFGGDKAQIDWDQGIRGVGRVTETPFEKGYDSEKPKNFKIKIMPLDVLVDSIPPKAARTHSRLAYDIYEIPYIGANHFPTQAISSFEESAGIKALAELYNEYGSYDFSQLVDGDSFFSSSGNELRMQDFLGVVAALQAKPFLIFTGLSGSGKTLQAIKFAKWITPHGGSKDVFCPGARIPSSNVTYIVGKSDNLSVEFWNSEDPETAIKVSLPREMISEWATYITSNDIPFTTQARDIREGVKVESKFSDQLHSFETHLKAAAIALIEKDNIPVGTKNYELIAVGADWTSNENLLGYPDALNLGHYRKPDNGTLDLILRAKKNPDQPFFLILDEMNLSHVERYFSDFLSAMESGEPIHLHDGGELELWGDVPGKLTLSKNLFVIGTVNIDETTYMFSPKVLDRANVVEFRVSDDEMSSFLNNPAKPDLDSIAGQGVGFAKSFVAEAGRTNIDLADSVRNAVMTVLMEFFPALKDAGAEFGYRTAHEICRFVYFYEQIGDDFDSDDTLSDATFIVAMDTAIMQKLLPKLHGSRNKIEKILRIMAQLCLVDSNQEPFQEDDEDIKYPLSYEKLKRMHKRVKDDGFTSYAEA
jgi:hypothetical protein